MCSKFKQVRATGERIIMGRPCLSACTLLTGIAPRNRVRSPWHRNYAAHRQCP
jgi:hypothetical protein